ncbi:hypothetical protein CO010_03850, partial [Candidatus Shapirobacteria bacterium CG_4_8_14_3_um_filter_39_11]
NSEKEIEKLIEKLLKEHPEVIEGYKKGKPQALGMIIGLVKKDKNVLVSIDDIIKKIPL